MRTKYRSEYNSTNATLCQYLTSVERRRYCATKTETHELASTASSQSGRHLDTSFDRTCTRWRRSAFMATQSDGRLPIMVEIADRGTNGLLKCGACS